MFRIVLLLLYTVLLRGEVIDRIAIAVENRVITELQIDEELRVTAFLNHSPIPRDRNARRAAADRLVAQLLVRHEIQVSHYPEPAGAEVENYLEAVRSTFKTQEIYEGALREYQITQESLTQHLTDQLGVGSVIPA